MATITLFAVTNTASAIILIEVDISNPEAVIIQATSGAPLVDSNNSDMADGFAMIDFFSDEESFPRGDLPSGFALGSSGMNYD